MTQHHNPGPNPKLRHKMTAASERTVTMRLHVPWRAKARPLRWVYRHPVVDPCQRRVRCGRENGAGLDDVAGSEVRKRPLERYPLANRRALPQSGEPERRASYSGSTDWHASARAFRTLELATIPNHVLER